MELKFTTTGDMRTETKNFECGGELLYLVVKAEGKNGVAKISSLKIWTVSDIKTHSEIPSGNSLLPIKDFSSYGLNLDIAKKIELGSCYDVVARSKFAYIIGSGALYVADIASPGNPEIVGKLSGLGSVRQIAVRDNIVFITSRADGVFIVDVANPKNPALLCHYDSVELATGIAVSGNLLFVANRDFGVEIIDVNDPKNPVHLSSVSTGEAQSVTCQGNYLYAGVWSGAKLVIVDITNPRTPKIIAKGDLDGFGDGVCVNGKFAFAATGHHQPSWLKTAKTPDSEGYGQGHGLEIFDISDPINLKFISRIKFPSYYCLYPDTWKVIVSGNYAFCSDAYNGVFIIDIRDPLNPVSVGYRQLEYNERTRKEEPVVGLAITEGYVYAAGYSSGLYVIAAQKLAKPSMPVQGKVVHIPAEDLSGERQKECRVYKPGGQIYALAFMEDDICVVAAGSAGFRTVKILPEIQEISVYKTSEIVFNVFVRNNFLYVSEGMAGLSIWEYRGKGDFVLIGRYIPESDKPDKKMTVKQSLVGVSGKYAMLQIDFFKIEIVDISNPKKIKKVLEKNMGIMYGDQIALVKERYACAYSPASGSGLFWYDLEAVDDHLCISGPLSGVAYKSGIGSYGDKLIITSADKYKILSKDDTDVKSLPEVQIGSGVSGNPSIYHNILLQTDRREGKVFVTDISDIKKPKFIHVVETPGNSGRAVIHRNALLVPDGYEGLRV